MAGGLAGPSEDDELAPGQCRRGDECGDRPAVEEAGGGPEEDAESAASTRRHREPTATSTRNTSSASPPRLAPRTEPASITPSVCAVIGTGMPGAGSGGSRPNAAT